MRGVRRNGGKEGRRREEGGAGCKSVRKRRKDCRFVEGKVGSKEGGGGKKEKKIKGSKKGRK